MPTKKAAVLAVSVVAVAAALAVVLLWRGFAVKPVAYMPNQIKSDVQSEARSTPAAPVSGSGSEPAATAQQRRLEQLYQQGYQYYNEEQYQNAINLEDQVIREDPDEQDPTYFQACTVKGIALCYYGYFDAANLRNTYFDEGMQEIDRALQIDPKYSSALFNKALAYELYGQYDTALYWYDQTIAVDPGSVWSYYGKAAIYGRRGDVSDTVKYLQQAIALNPSVRKDARGEQDFDNVRSSPEFQDLVNSQP